MQFSKKGPIFHRKNTIKMKCSNTVFYVYFFYAILSVQKYVRYYQSISTLSTVQFNRIIQYMDRTGICSMFYRDLSLRKKEKMGRRKKTCLLSSFNKPYALDKIDFNDQLRMRFWIRQYPYNSHIFHVIDILADNFL